MAERSEPKARWRGVADFSKKNAWMLRVADRLGRGKGRLRVLDRWGRVAWDGAKVELGGWDKKELAAVWLGHASVLFRIGGMTVLADPVFSDRIGLGLGVMTAGPRRLVGVPVGEGELPKIDVVLVSHAHFDHLDRPTLWRLAHGPARGAAVFTSEHNRDLLSDLGFASVQELAVGGVAQFGSVGITAVDVKHWGARVFHDSHRGSCAFLIEGGGRRVLFGADTAHQVGWKSIGAAGGVDLACVGIGAYNPWISNHATPEQAAEMAGDAGARVLMPMHFGTFKLSYEPIAEPMERFRRVWSGPVAGGEVGTVWEA